MLMPDGRRRCPADGTRSAAVRHMRAAAVHAAIRHPADVRILAGRPELDRVGGIAAILRF
jgi:hypothetical protein